MRHLYGFEREDPIRHYRGTKKVVGVLQGGAPATKS